MTIVSKPTRTLWGNRCSWRVGGGAEVAWPYRTSFRVDIAREHEGRAALNAAVRGRARVRALPGPAAAVPARADPVPAAGAVVVGKAAAHPPGQQGRAAGAGAEEPGPAEGPRDAQGEKYAKLYKTETFNY